MMVEVYSPEIVFLFFVVMSPLSLPIPTTQMMSSNIFTAGHLHQAFLKSWPLSLLLCALPYLLVWPQRWPGTLREACLGLVEWDMARDMEVGTVLGTILGMALMEAVRMELGTTTATETLEETTMTPGQAKGSSLPWRPSRSLCVWSSSSSLCPTKAFLRAGGSTWQL